MNENCLICHCKIEDNSFKIYIEPYGVCFFTAALTLRFIHKECAEGLNL